MWACRTNGAERKEATLARGSVVGVERGKRRFERVIEVPLPDAATRELMLRCELVAILPEPVATFRLLPRHVAGASS